VKKVKSCYANHYLINLEIKLKYTVQLTKPGYLEIMSVEEWNVCSIKLNDNQQVNEICESYSLQLDEFPHCCDVSQLLVFIRMAFVIGNIKK
jgi:hypothetical protein